MLALTQAQISRPQKPEVEYDLEVEVMSNASEQKDISDYDEPEDVYANEPLADWNWLTEYVAERKKRNTNLKRNYALDMPFSFSGLLLHLKTTYLSGISFLSMDAKIVPKLESDQWPGMTSQTALYPDYFK